MGNFYMESTQINYRRDEKLKTVDQKLQELSETSAIDTDIAPVFKSTNTYQPGDMVYYRNKLYVFNVEHTGTWAAADVTATDVTTELSSLKSGLIDIHDGFKDAIGWDNHKNLLPITIDDIKANNTNGTWSGNTYTLNGVSFTVNLDQYGHVLSVTVNGTNTNTWNTRLWLTKESQTLVPLDAGDYDIRCMNTSEQCYLIINTTIWQEGQAVVNSNGKLVTIDENCYLTAPLIQLRPSVTIDNKTLYPEFYKHKYSGMDYQPYYPVIGTAVEELQSATTVSSGTITAEEGVTITNYTLQKSLKTVFLDMLVKFTPTLGTSQLLCVLPSGYRAQSRLFFVGKNGTNGKSVSCETDSYGAVRIFPTSDDSSAVSTDYFLTITFFTS